MIWTRFQWLALTAFIAVEILIFAGAVVRVTGSGLGCPDWPFCYGCLVPPSSARDIDFTKLDLEKFRAKAARLGRDPATITPESLRASFDPVATWVEYINRLISVPAGLIVLALFGASFSQLRKRQSSVFWASALALLLVIVNAWLGARVVVSGLKPGIITLHMAMAILLQCVLVFIAWRGTPAPWRMRIQSEDAVLIRRLGVLLFCLVVIEGIMGSQVREMTDHLAMIHAGALRQTWTLEIEHSAVYLVHRSFSWLILGGVFWLAGKLKKAHGRLLQLESCIVALVVGQMLLGVVLAQAGVYRVAQILHIGLSSFLVSGLFLWLLGSRRENVQGELGASTNLR